MHAPFRQNDAALPIDRALIEGRGVRPILEDEQRAIERAGRIGRHAQRVLRVVVARRRVRVGADAQAEIAEEVVDRIPGKVRRPLEFHVLDEVRQPALVVVFEH
ncbi:MAG TPA: hypothetical protein VGI48_19585 [Caldimonas sp.]|jgi:hypothetical protein